MCITSCVFMNMKNMGISWLKKQQQQNLSWAMWINMKHFYISLFYGMKHCFANNLKTKQDQTLLWTCVAGARRCVNSRYAKFKYTGMKSDYIQISQCNLQ